MVQFLAAEYSRSQIVLSDRLCYDCERKPNRKGELEKKNIETTELTVINLLAQCIHFQCKKNMERGT